MLVIGQTVKRVHRKLWLTFRASPAERRHALVGPAHIWQMEREFQIRFLKSVGLRPEHFLLDLGCGTLRGGIPIIKHLKPGHYYGVDVRQDVLSEATKEVAENQLARKQPILFLTDDVRSLSIDMRFDVIWAFDILYILSDDKLADCLSFASTHLKKTGVLYGNAMIGKREDGWWDHGFPLIRREMSSYSLAAQLSGLIAEDMGTIESLGFGTGQKKHDEKWMLRFSRQSYLASESQRNGA